MRVEAWYPKGRSLVPSPSEPLTPAPCAALPEVARPYMQTGDTDGKIVYTTTIRLSRGVVAAQGFLIPLVLVRIQAGQPVLDPISNSHYPISNLPLAIIGYCCLCEAW